MAVAESEILTGEEVAKLLKVSRITLWRLRKHQGLPYFKTGRELRFFKSDVIRWAREQQYKEAQLGLNFERQHMRKRS